MGLSLCMIVKNEEAYLAHALASVKGLADEVILVDTGSTDRTKDIARSFTDKIYDFTWCDDFSAARNFSLQQATQDWILILDADEIIAHEDHAAILDLLAKKDIVAFSFIQMNYTYDVHLVGYRPLLSVNSYSEGYTGYLPVEKIRLFRNNKQIFFEGAVHETVEYTAAKFGTIMHTDLPIHHYQFAKGEERLREKQLQYLHIQEQHLSSYPNQAKAYRDIGSTYYTYTEETEKALSFFEQSLTRALHPKTYLGILLCLIKLKRFADVQPILHDALHHFPDDSALQQLKKTLFPS